MPSPSKQNLDSWSLGRDKQHGAYVTALSALAVWLLSGLQEKEIFAPFIHPSRTGNVKYLL